MSRKYMIALLIIGFMLCGCFMVGTSYAAYQVEGLQTNYNEVKFGCFNMGWQELSGYNINLTTAYPVDDGTNKTPYAVTVTNNCTDTDAPYATRTVLTINSLKNNTLDDGFIMVSMQEDGNALSAPVLLTTKETGGIQSSDTETQTSYILTTTNIAPGESKTFKVWMWIRGDAENEVNQDGLLFNARVGVYTEVTE